jgi:Ca2+-binding EF-hand superfamily protein
LKIFLRYAAEGKHDIQKENLQAALHDLHVEIKSDQVDELFHDLDLDKNGGLDLLEFKKALQAIQPTASVAFILKWCTMHLSIPLHEHVVMIDHVI